ncbi:hypothetical protein M0R45_010416 [Rubus argutus]|uniref:Uncharacterized protein n=1 Tax=Rubus argutus TaxID=59490 RepID=A0AAW1Y7Q8_RUBAR
MSREMKKSSDGGKKDLIMNSNPNDEEDHDNYKSEADHEDEQQPWSTFKPKKGSVIPQKRRLVKRMMVDQIVQLCSVSGKPQEAAAAETSKTKKSSSNHVYSTPP